jgi:hypothetical protein
MNKELKEMDLEIRGYYAGTVVDEAGEEQPQKLLVRRRAARARGPTPLRRR